MSKFKIFVLFHKLYSHTRYNRKIKLVDIIFYDKLMKPGTYDDENHEIQYTNIYRILKILKNFTIFT